MDLEIINLTDAYKSIINPEYLITLFNNETEFINWLYKGTKEDLKFTLQEFIKSNLFEYCTIIQKIIEIR
jgi:hypothetical protein